jgi:ribosomal protein L37AE/L43A
MKKRKNDTAEKKEEAKCKKVAEKKIGKAGAGVFFCPKCKKQMALWATGRELRHYHCPGCCISRTEKKEEV